MEFSTTLGAKTTLVQLENFKKENVIEMLKGKDIIWFAGGYRGYLLYWIRRTGLDKELRKILQDGTLLVGSSSGSMILSKDQDVSEWFIGDEEPGASLLPGLNFIDFDFYPHYEDDLFDEIKKKYKGQKMYLVKNGEVIIVEDDKVKILGEDRILVKNKIYNL